MNLKAFNDSVGFLNSIQRDTARIPLVVRDLDGNEVQLQGVEVEWQNRMQDCAVVLRLAPGMRLDETNPEAVVETASEQAEAPPEYEYTYPEMPPHWQAVWVIGRGGYTLRYREHEIGIVSQVGRNLDFVPTKGSLFPAITRQSLEDIISVLDTERLERALFAE